MGKSDRGAGAAEYGGMLLIIASIAAALTALGLPDAVPAKINSAICGITGGSCPADQSGAAANPLPVQSRQRPSRRPVSQEPRILTDEELVQRNTEDALNEIPIGKEALAMAQALGVRFEYGRGGGSHYREASNTIYIDIDDSVFEPAASVVHEIGHALRRGTPDPKSMCRQEFIDAAIAEEAVVHTRAIQAHQQFQEWSRRTRKTAPFKTSLQLEYEYAYNDAVRRANVARRAGQPPLTPQEEQQVGEQAGRERVRREIAAGTKSGTHPSVAPDKTYAQYYGDGWDRVNQNNQALRARCGGR